jgi:hypothetical protein
VPVLSHHLRAPRDLEEFDENASQADEERPAGAVEKSSELGHQWPEAYDIFVQPSRRACKCCQLFEI